MVSLRRWRIFAALAAAPTLALPVFNPDLFWHLSAFHRMLELKGVPRVDWLSWTREGAPWIDFEWLSQLVYGGIHAAGGVAGLWLFKVLLLGAAGLLLERVLRDYELGPEPRAAGVAVWYAEMLAHADLRPELFSVLCFLLLLGILEAARLGRARPSPWAMLALFAAWSNLHAGFAAGLVLLAFYLPEAGLPAAAAAVAGTMLQPAGPKIYLLLWRHAREIAPVQDYIMEWAPPRLGDFWRLPHWALLAAAALAWSIKTRAEGAPPARLTAALLFFAWAGSSQARLGVYFAALAVPISLHWSAPRLRRLEGGRLAAFCGGAILAAGLFSLACGWSFGTFRSTFNPVFIPEASAAFLAREKGLARLRLYNPWGWGGYLGWRLRPEYRVFQDGRYLFHPLLTEAAQATRDPRAWQNFLNGYKIDLVVLENMPLMLRSIRRYPDGSEKPFLRPYFVFYMPKADWALLHWDEKALIFARRAAVGAGYLTGREFRYARPHDEAALKDALAREEIPADAVRKEFERHQKESQ